MKSENQVTHADALRIAKAHHQSGNLTLANTTYKDILKVLPEDYTSLHFLGVIAYQRHAPEEALEYIERALEVNQDEPDTWNVYAVVLAQLGRKEEAIEKWNKAIELNPDNSEYYSNLSHAHWELKQYDLALEAGKKTAELRPDAAESYINFGNAYTGMGDHEKAIETWKKALEHDPLQPNAHINIGNALRDLGRISEAAPYSLKGTELAPNNPTAWMNLGNIKRDQTDLGEAEKMYRKAISLRPNYVDAHNNLTVVLMDSLRHDEAIISARYTLAFEPNNAQALNNLATILKETGQLEEAEMSARKALQLTPDSIEIKIDLADILFLSERLEEAETLFNEAKQESEETADTARIYLKLSAVLERANRIDEALEAIEKAIEIASETPEIYHRQAMVYFMSGDIENALKALDKALELKPHFPHALATKSEILQAHGDMENALKYTREGIEQDNGVPFLYFTLSKLKKFTEDDADLKKMKQIQQHAEKFGIPQQTSLEFALGKAHEDIKDFPQAFIHYKNGNDLKRRSIIYNRVSERESFKKVRAAYPSREFIDSFKDKATKDETPIFIVGMPRSGTTLTEQIISSHPDVFGAGELYYLGKVEKDLGFVNENNCKKMGDRYIEMTREIDEDAKTAVKITDKMPGNYMRIGQILCLYPNAKIIHCRRNPMDTCLSCYKQLFARGQYWSYNLDEMADHYAQYEALMDYWRDMVGDRMLEVYYEDTVNDFENQARKLLDYVGLEWNDACLTPHKTKRSIMTASKGQVRKPIYKTSVEGWKRYEEELQPLAVPLDKFVRKNS